MSLSLLPLTVWALQREPRLFSPLLYSGDGGRWGGGGGSQQRIVRRGELKRLSALPPCRFGDRSSDASKIIVIHRPVRRLQVGPGLTASLRRSVTQRSPKGGGEDRKCSGCEIWSHDPQRDSVQHYH